jgi:NAD(P)-dependent dehydrogenase (short-subunit alcohol dehydrogenase family)
MLRGKNIVLTGAGRGIGKIIAECTAQYGAAVALLSRTQGELKEVWEKVQAINPDCFFIECDISDEESVLRAYEFINGRFEKIDVLINNAGIQAPIGPFASCDFHAWKNTIEVNLVGTARLTHLVLPGMIERKAGKIINLSGGGATSPRPNFSAYGVSKTGVVRFTETLAEELKPFNIDVNAIAPGAINTTMLTDVLNAGLMAGREYAEAQQRQKNGGSDPLIAAKLICFLASDHSNGITGKLLSAPWDDWSNPHFCEELKNNTDLATLRRIDNKTFYKKS